MQFILDCMIRTSLTDREAISIHDISIDRTHLGVEDTEIHSSAPYLDSTAFFYKLSKSRI